MKSIILTLLLFCFIFDFVQAQWTTPYPTTIISWYSQKDGFVTLDIFDILGRQIDVLVNEYRASGFNFVEFDAKNLPSGVYFYKIQTGVLTEIRKMIIQK